MHRTRPVSALQRLILTPLGGGGYPPVRRGPGISVIDTLAEPQTWFVLIQPASEAQRSERAALLVAPLLVQSV